MPGDECTEHVSEAAGGQTAAATEGGFPRCGYFFSGNRKVMPARTPQPVGPASSGVYAQ